MSKFVWILVFTSGIGFGASKPLPIKRHKRKSPTTAQLFKKGPFKGVATFAAASPTVFN